MQLSQALKVLAAVAIAFGLHVQGGAAYEPRTVGALAFVHAVRPDFLDAGKVKAVRGSVVWVTGLLIALAVFLLLQKIRELRD